MNNTTSSVPDPASDGIWYRLSVEEKDAVIAHLTAQTTSAVVVGIESQTMGCEMETRYDVHAITAGEAGARSVAPNGTYDGPRSMSFSYPVEDLLASPGEEIEGWGDYDSMNKTQYDAFFVYLPA